MTTKVNSAKLNQLIQESVANTLTDAKTTKKSRVTKKVEEPKVEEQPKSTTKKTTTKPKAEAKKEKVTKEVTERNKNKLIEEVTANREVKYIYPDDVTDTLSRKAWRQKTRNKLEKLERDMYRIKDQNSKEFKAAKKAYDEYRKSVLKEAV